MKYLGIILVVVVPYVSIAQVEKVVSPYQGFTDEETTQEEDTNNTILQSIAIQESGTSSTQEETQVQGTSNTSSSNEQENTEAQREPEAALEDYVGELNEQYKKAQEQCTTGSWLRNIWCKITNLI